TTGRAPVGRRKDYRPKLRRGLVELKRNGGVPGFRGFNADHMALLLQFRFLVHQKDRLPRLYLDFQLEQTTMSVDHDGLRIFAKLLAIARLDLHEHRY